MFNIMYLDCWGSRRLRISLGVFLGIIWLHHLSTLSDFSLDLDIPNLLHIDVSPRTQQRNLTYLPQTINLSPTFTYTARTIRTKFYKGSRPDITRVNTTLFPPFSTLSTDDLEGSNITTLPSLTLHVPSSPKVDTSIFVFGIATTLPRLNLSLPQLSRWLPSSGSPLHIMTPPDPSFSHLGSRAAALNMNISITHSELPFPIAYFSLVKLLRENRGKATKWLVLLDDDTFIPSLASLAAHLSSTYDHKKEILIAAMTDDKRQLETWGLIPFGGGGIFICVSLAENLTQPAIWDRCVGGMGHEQGDGILSACLNEYTSVRPTFDAGLNQMDIRGPPATYPAAGLFESGRRLLTIHHWRSWFEVDVVRAAMVSEVCGNECLFQRWSFGDGWVVSNGFSVVEFLGPLGEVEFQGVEITWEGDRERFLHRIGPLREADGLGVKRRFMLVDVKAVEGGVRQLYHFPRREGVGMDRVVELFWVRG